MIKKTIFSSMIIFLSLGLMAQDDYMQTIRGVVKDKDSKMALPGATVALQNSNPPVGTATDINGKWRLENVPVGRQGIVVTYMGYKPVSLNNLILSSGKELVLEVEMEESVIVSEEVVVTAKRKDLPLNKMASVSARSFTVEETEKYAGSRGDVARMATNFAGVLSANDQRNDIIIRGNSPSGLLWRLDGIEIPNPNHFAQEGTTGGPVGMLNNNLLRNSDFFTGAFPAEYGNALSGVFDLRLREGNNEKHEFLFQSGFNGFELGAEGPFHRDYNGSYLFNYRYSTMELLDKAGVNMGTSGIPKYKDLSFKVHLPVKNGVISLIGLGGDSEIAMLDSKNPEEEQEDLYTMGGMDLVNGSTTGASGLSYTHLVNEKTYAKISLSGLYQWGGTTIDTLDDNGVPHPNMKSDASEYRLSLSAMINTKHNRQFTSRGGISVDRLGHDYQLETYDFETNSFQKPLNFSRSLLKGNNLYQAYYQGLYKINDKIHLHPGFQVMYLDLAKSFALEPRMGGSYQYANNRKLSAGYGYHSKMQAMSTYFFGTYLPDGTYHRTNMNVGFTRSHQFVLGHDWNITPDLRLKLESYYQYLFDVPVESHPSSFSMINTGDTYGIPAKDSLVNKGVGRNYGIEMTLEKFFSKKYYYLLTASLFDSKYQGSDKVWRNTAFNSNYIVNALVGKEFEIGKRSALNIDLKFSYAGGKRYTPVNIEKSRELDNFTTVLYDEVAYSKQFPDFLKADFKIGFRLNGKRVSQEWQFYVENFTNHQNVLYYAYSKAKDDVSTYYQLGMFPMMQYRLQF